MVAYFVRFSQRGVGCAVDTVGMLEIIDAVAANAGDRAGIAG
jgi:hypothetical protein